jgi:hypothetical protein
VEAVVREMSDVLIPLVGILGVGVGTVGGYLVGMAQSRNERRDNALADIYKELALFHRYLASWTANYDPDPKETSMASGDIPARKHVKDQYEKLTYTFHDVNAIWVGKDTYDMIQGFSSASRDLLNDLTDMQRDGAWLLPDGTNPNAQREEQITKRYYKVRDALRTEVEASRDPVTWVRYHIVKRKNA